MIKFKTGLFYAFFCIFNIATCVLSSYDQGILGWQFVQSIPITGEIIGGNDQTICEKTIDEHGCNILNIYENIDGSFKKVKTLYLNYGDRAIFSGNYWTFFIFSNYSDKIAVYNRIGSIWKKTSTIFNGHSSDTISDTIIDFQSSDSGNTILITRPTTLSLYQRNGDLQFIKKFSKSNTSDHCYLSSDGKFLTVYSKENKWLKLYREYNMNGAWCKMHSIYLDDTITGRLSVSKNGRKLCIETLSENTHKFHIYSNKQICGLYYEWNKDAETSTTPMTSGFTPSDFWFSKNGNQLFIKFEANNSSQVLINSFVYENEAWRKISKSNSLMMNRINAYQLSDDGEVFCLKEKNIDSLIIYERKKKIFEPIFSTYKDTCKHLKLLGLAVRDHLMNVHNFKLSENGNFFWVEVLTTLADDIQLKRLDLYRNVTT